MKKEQRKKIINIIVIIVCIGMIGSLFAGIKTSNGSSKKTNNDVVIAEIKEAQFGSLIKVNLTENGKEQYKDAAKYALFDSKGQMSKVDGLDKEVTVFPAMKPKDEIIVKIYTKENKELAETKTSLIKAK